MVPNTARSRDVAARGRCARLACALAALLGSACGGGVQRYPAPAAPVAGVSHADFEALLAAYVSDDGRVAYDRWADTPRDVAALDDYLGVMASATPDTRPGLFAGDPARMSYWINLYNAIVLREVLRRWPLSSVREVRTGAGSYLFPGKGFFRDLRFAIGGRAMSLDDIEHKILRSRFRDARIHFAINCGSASCPVLQRDAFDPRTLEDQLEAASRAFINDAGNVTVDHDARVLRLSKIFQWYRGDFLAFARARGITPGDEDPHIGDFLAVYAEPALAAALARARAEDYRVAYRDYDWSVNRGDGASGSRTAASEPGARSGWRQRAGEPPSDANEADEGGAAQGAEPMPELAIRLLDGTTWRPADTRGKVVLLDVWATYCKPCRESFPEIEKLWQRLRARGFVVIAVSEDDDPAPIPAFVAELGVSFPIGHDRRRVLLRPPLSVRVMPTEILIDRRGRIRHRHEGLRKGDIERLTAQIEALLAEPP